MTTAPTFDPFAGPAILTTAPSTEPQREIWTATLLGNDASLAYNESIALRMHGPLDESALRASLQDLVERHESLRTTFGADGTTLCVLANIDATLHLEDLTSLAQESRDARVAEHCVQVVEEPFDLERGPLFRVTLFKLAPEESLLTFTAHHIVFDGYSTGILVTDWGHLYTSHKLRTVANLKPAEAFSDYARKEKLAVDTNDRTSHERFWIEQFPGEVPILELPYDRPRPILKTYASRRIDIILESELVRDVKKTGAKQGASLFATLLSAFGLLMSRLSGQTDVVIGIPAAGQSVGEHDTLVGHCVNMLPFRGNFEPAQTLKNLLSVTRRQVLDAYDHQEYTFGSLLKKLTIPRDPSRLPLVSVVFNMDRGLTAEAVPFDGLAVNVRTNPRHFENFDLFINAVDMRDHVILECQYNTDLFDARTIVNWFESYALLLRSMTENPEAAVGDLRLLTDQQQQCLNGWNNTRAQRLEAACVHQLIEAQAARTPDAIAVEFEGSTICYRDLDRKANQLARRLRELGVGRDVLVGLCLERSIAMIVGLLAVHKAGGGYVPLDPGYPRDRLSYMVEDSKMPVLLTDRALREELSLPAKHIICVDEEATALAALSTEPLDSADSDATANSLAYVIYTSGSTGKPKGVLIEHRSVVNLLGSLHVTPGWSTQDVVLAITTLSFDIAVSELILPLTAGARILLASRDVAADGARLMQTISDGEVTFIDATPATYRLLLAAGWTGDQKLRVVCTGEAMPRDLALELVPRVGQVWNGYGPTETTVWSTFYEVKAPVGRILIGRPVDNTQIYILDARGNEVPVGVTGEMFIGGLGLARGYLNRPDLTAERFIADPFSATPGSRMYKTGDLARYLTDGNIECLGRNDNQVKLRGFRIELGEIENALATHPSVASAAVIVREDRPGDRRLCAYFVAAATVSEGDLRTHLKQTLPDYMVPQHFAVLERMPLTPSGKIDRKSLPAPSGEARVSENFVEPATESEKLVAELWKAALVVSRVSANDDFFALGGHSLLASQILARLRVEHGVVIPFRKMFEAPTIAAFARLVDECGASGAKTPIQTIPKISNRQAAQLSLSQERLWSLDEMDPNSWRPHVLPAAWRLKGPLNVPCLKQAMQHFVDRHDLLRTSFHLVDGKPVQRVADTATISLQEKDLSNLSPEAREAQLTALFDADAETPYDLTVAPLLRSILIRIGDNEHVLYSSRHNIIWDGWSFDLYLRDLSTAYGAICRGETPKLPPLPISYLDFAAWHREWLRGPEHAKQLAYWQKQLDGEIAPLALPTDRKAPKARTHVGANAMVNVTLAEAEQLTQIAHDCGATLYTVLLSAYATLLQRYTGQNEFLIGTPIRARTRPETEDIIGPFVNTLALRFRVDPRATFLELVAQARDTTLDAFSHQESPLEALGAKAPSVRINFSLQDARTRPTAFGDLEIAQQHVMHRSAVNDLTLWAMYSTRNLLVVLNYSTEQFNESTIRHFLDAYRTLLSSILANPRSELGLLDVNSPKAIELAKLAGHSQSAPSTSPSLGRSLAERAVAAPLLVALRGSSKNVTFQELSNSVGNAMSLLQGASVTRETPVILLGTRNASACVAAIAALELGAQLIPLDRELPSGLVEPLCTANSATCLIVDSLARSRHGALIANCPSTQTLPLESFVVDRAGSDTAKPPVTLAESTSVVLRVPYIDLNGALCLGEATYGDVISAATDLASRLSLGATDSVAAIDDFATDSWLLEVLSGLLGGATVHLADEDSSDKSCIVDASWLQTAKPTVVLGPSDLLPSLCAHSSWSAPVQRIVSTGRPATGSDLDTLRKRANVVHHVFAFNEGSIWSCSGISKEPTTRYQIGSALGSTTLSIVDTLGRQSPVGVLGDVVLKRGDGSAVNTGTRARLLGDGTFEYRETAPRAAWLRGQRVSLIAIERHLLQHEALHDATAVVVERENDTPVLVGYIVPKPGASYTESELRKHLRKRLPEQLVPQDFMEVSSIPRHANGAPVIEKLPSSYVSYARVFIAPRTESERLLAEVWQTALKLERVSVDDNFFNIGGHSLLCFQVIDDVQRQTGIRLSPRALLLDTLEQVATSLQKAPTPSSTVAAPTATTEASLSGKLFGKLRKLTGV